MRKLLLGAVVVFSALLGLSTVQAEPVAGKEYAELRTPVEVSEPGKIEVVEMFWYGCGHCYQFEPYVNKWAETLPEDVNFVRIPALFGNIWDAHGQMFLTLQSMGVEPQVHTAIFDAIQRQRKRLATPDEMADFLATQGIDKDTFLKTFNSFGIKTQMEKYRKLAMAYQVQGVPTMLVNGKYRFDIVSSGGPGEALQVADYLIEKERKAAAAN